jgi:DNA-binding CsgD family transcriptional regulator
MDRTHHDDEPVLRVALLAEREHLAEAVTREIEAIGVRVALQRVQAAHSVKDTLVAFPANVVLADPSSAGQDTWRAYRVARTIRPSAPFILLTEALNEELVVSFARYNPDDLVLVGNLARLGPAIQVALELRRPLAKLSPRQVEVLTMVAEGRRTREIAVGRGLSPKTVESHRSAMMKRLGLHDLSALVRYAVRMGLVPADPIVADTTS